MCEGIYNCAVCGGAAVTVFMDYSDGIERYN